MIKNLKKRKNGIIVITMAVLALFAVLFYKGIDLQREKAALQEKVRELRVEKQEEDERTEELKARQAYMTTKNYIEDVAREKLGLVYKDEIIFKEKDDDSE